MINIVHQEKELQPVRLLVILIREKGKVGLRGRWPPALKCGLPDPPPAHILLDTTILICLGPFSDSQSPNHWAGRRKSSEAAGHSLPLLCALTCLGLLAAHWTHLAAFNTDGGLNP